MSIKPLTDVDIRLLVSSCGRPAAAEQFALSYVTLRTAYEGAVGHNASLASMATSAEQDRHVANTLLTAVTLERDEARIKLQAAVDASEAASSRQVKRDTADAMTEAERLVYAVAFATTVLHVNSTVQWGVAAEVAYQAVMTLRKTTPVDPNDSRHAMLRAFKESR